MRLACCVSSLLSSRSTSAESSTLYAMTFQGVLQRDGLLFTAADVFQRTFGQIHVLKILQVFEDGFTDIVGLGAPSAPGELLQAFFDGLRKPNGQHSYLALQV